MTRSLLLLALLLPVLALAKPPSSKEVDEALLRLSPGDLSEVDAGQRAVVAAEAAQAAVEQDIAFAKNDIKAAKSWDEASAAVLKALRHEQEAAQARQDDEELTRLARVGGDAESNAAWRKARTKQHEARLAFDQARLAHAKTSLALIQAEYQVTRMEAYARAVGQSGDVDTELGKRHTSVGKAKKQDARAATKRDKAEDAWKTASLEAERLSP